MKKLKLKPGVKKLFVVIVVSIIVLVFGINKYKEYRYKQTNEYKLTEVGYTLDEAKLIIKKLNSKNEAYFVKNTKNNYIIDLLKEKYFLEKNLYEYMDYRKENKKKDLSDIVAIVNVHANKDWYDKDTVKPTDLSKKELILVNKFNYLSKDFVPEDIVDINLSFAYADNKVSKITADAFITMASKAKKDNVLLLANSSYRDYERQESVYKDFYYSKGLSYADAYAARAGYSEHQTGLALDIFTGGATTDDFEKSDAYKWLQKHAHEYGFILRYPKGKEYLTGYNYESWHYRYLGVETATKVYESGLTYDEYYAYYIEK